MTLSVHLLISLSLFHLLFINVCVCIELCSPSEMVCPRKKYWPKIRQIDFPLNESDQIIQEPGFYFFSLNISLSSVQKTFLKLPAKKHIFLSPQIPHVTFTFMSMQTDKTSKLCTATTEVR